MKAMLSQPMAGKTEAEIVATRERAVKALESMGYEVVNTLFTDEWYAPENMKKRGVENIPLCFLAKSLENMSLCHAAYFCKGWENARGCRIEHEAAKAYGMKIIMEMAWTGPGAIPDAPCPKNPEAIGARPQGAPKSDKGESNAKSNL